MHELKSISGINTNTIEGRLLMAALAKLTTESQTDKQPDEVLQQCCVLANEMYKNQPALTAAAERQPFVTQLATLINQNSLENESNTPDFILASFLNECLKAFTWTNNRREKWYNKSLAIGGVQVFSNANYLPHFEE